MVAFVSMAPAVNPSLVLGGFLLAAMGTWIAQARPQIRRLALATVCALLVSGAWTVVSAADVPCVRCVFDWFPVICFFVYPC